MNKFIDILALRILLVGFCALLGFIEGTSYASAQEEGQAKENVEGLLPEAFIQDEVFDFGTVKQGATVTQAFTIHNKGEAPLKVLDVQADCGCTVAEPESRFIEPGSSAKLNVVFDTSGFRGYKVKTIRIYTNDPAKSSVQFALKGNIQRDIEVEPARLYFDKIRRGEEQSKRVTFQKFSSDDTEVLDVFSRSEHIKIEKDERGFNVWLSNKVPFGVFRERILIKTTSKETPIIHLPVFARVNGDLVAKPSDVSFGLLEGPLVKDVSREVVLTNSSGKELKVLKIKSDTKGVSATSESDIISDSFKLAVKLGSGLSGVLHANITVETDHPDAEQKVLTIPVYGIVAKKGK